MIDFIGYWLFTLGAVAVVFFCLTLGWAYRTSTKLGLKKFFEEIGVYDIEEAS